MNWFIFFLGLTSLLHVKGNSYFTCTDKVAISLTKTGGIISFTDIEQDTLFVAQTVDSANKCNPTSVNAEEVKFSFNFNECEPEVEETDDKVTYTFTVWNKHYSDPSSVIRRGTTEYFKVTCSYDKAATATTNAFLADTNEFYQCTQTGVTINLLAKHFPAFKIIDPLTDVLYIGAVDNTSPPTECQPQSQTADEIVFQFGYDQCELVVEENDDEIAYVYHFRRRGAETISRSRQKQDLKCIFRKNYITNLQVTLASAQASPVGSSTGTSSMNMNISVPDDPSTESISNGQTVESGTRLHVDVQIPDDEQTSQFVVSLKTCFATQSADENDEKKINFIDDSCPAYSNDLNPETLNVISNGEGTTSSFEFDTFEWKQLSTQQAQQLYITCLAEKCDASSHTCVGKCDSQEERVRRSFASRNVSDILQAGPFYISGSKSGLSKSTCSKNNLCSDICVKTQDKEECHCRHGRKLSVDGATCTDLDKSFYDRLHLGPFQYIFALATVVGTFILITLLYKKFSSADVKKNIII